MKKIDFINLWCESISNLPKPHGPKNVDSAESDPQRIRGLFAHAHKETMTSVVGVQCYTTVTITIVMVHIRTNV